MTALGVFAGLADTLGARWIPTAANAPTAGQIADAQATPASVASDLLGSIKVIEALLEGSASKIETIQNRGFLKSLVSSTSSDLVSISGSQNKINGLMLELIQEVITLNTMSYSFLAAVISELEDRARNGWKDAEGNFHQLSSTGREFAEKAKSIFLKIAEGSKDTQQRIEMNKVMISELQIEMARKAELDASQDLEIAKLHDLAAKEAVRVDVLSSRLQDSESVGGQLTHSVRSIVEQLGKVRKEQEQQARALEEAKLKAADLQEQLKRANLALANGKARVSRWLWTFGSAITALALAVLVVALPKL